jgi:lipoprotein-anchoring transpeptidase ErfK/SrfK
MTGTRHFRSALTLGAAAMLLGACTVRDASEQPAANAAAGASTQVAAGGAAPAATPAGAMSMPAGDSATAATAPGAMAPGAAAPGASVPAAGPEGANMSPDSVDVGRAGNKDTLPLSSMRLEVDLAARKLHVYDGDKRLSTHSVAVGSSDWPTKTGQWSIVQVVWNPEWNPPDESWAEQRTPKKSGAPDNPLGRAQLVYDPPRTIHGTNEPASIGKAVSHGSIRLSNAVVTQLGRQLMEATGAGKDDAWYRRVQQNRTEKVVVDLPQRVAIRVF